MSLVLMKACFKTSRVHARGNMLGAYCFKENASKALIKHQSIKTMSVFEKEIYYILSTMFNCCRSVSEDNIHFQVNEKFIFTSVSFRFPYLVGLSSKARVSGRQITCAAREHNA